MKRKMNSASILIILLLVGAATLFNAKRSPVESPSDSDPAIDEIHSYFNDNEWDNVTLFDIDFWFLKGSTLLEFESNTYERGGYVLRDNPVVPTGCFVLVWHPIEEFDGWEVERERIIDATGETFSFKDNGIIEQEYPSWQGHIGVVALLNGTGSQSTEEVGMMSGHLCDETDRVIVTLYYDKTCFNMDSPVGNGAVFIIAYSCHPTGEKPILPFVETD